MPGRLIAFCGIDGSGKTTQLRLAADLVRSWGYEVLVTKQPTDFFRRQPLVRAYLDHGDNSLGMPGMALLAAADRQLHIRTVLAPALARGCWVLTDRYVYSTYAFFLARGLDLQFLRHVNPNVPVPATTVLMDLCAHEGRRRVVAREGEIGKFEETDLAFMEKVRRNFHLVADESFLVVDATASARLIHEQIAERLSAVKIISRRSA